MLLPKLNIEPYDVPLLVEFLSNGTDKRTENPPYMETMKNSEYRVYALKDITEILYHFAECCDEDASMQVLFNDQGYDFMSLIKGYRENQTDGFDILIDWLMLKLKIKKLNKQKVSAIFVSFPVDWIVK